MTSPNNTALQAIPPATFTYLGQEVAAGYIKGGVLIGDLVNDAGTTPAGSTDNTPTVTLSGGVPVSAQLELQSTTGAFLVMRMTTTQRNAMITVVNGMMIFNTTSGTFQFYQGGAWVSLSAGAGGVTGPGSSTNNAIATWNGTGGIALNNSVVILDGSGNISGVNTIQNALGTVSAPSYTFTGETDVGMWSSAAHTLDFSTNSLEALQLTAPQASAVNYAYFTATATGAAPILGGTGTDTNVGLDLVTKGTGGVQHPLGAIATPSITFVGRTDTGLWSSAAHTLDVSTNSLRSVQFVSSPTSAVNYITFASAATTTNPVIGATGTDTNVSLSVTPKGTGGLTLTTGTFQALTGNVIAGSSGNAGTVSSFPGTATKGSLILAAVANTGNTTTTISNAAMGQASVISIPDPGASTANFLLNSGTNTMAAGSSIVLAKATGTESSNAVTASGNAGVITTSSLTTAGGSSYAITWTNTFISSTSTILLTIMGGTNTTENVTLKATAGSGTSTLTIYNNTVATALNGTILIGFAVF